MKTYVTFGREQVHTIGGKVFDKDCVAVIEAESVREGKDKVLHYFGGKFFGIYSEKTWKYPELSYFSRGYIHMDEEGDYNGTE